MKRPPQADDQKQLHRNNAAEWVMWFCLLPLAVAVWTLQCVLKEA